MDIKHTNRAAFAVAEKHNLDINEACKLMNSASIWLVAGVSIKHSFVEQLAYITALNIAHRVFLGGVHCVLPSNIPNLLKFKSEYFGDLIPQFGGRVIDDSSMKDDVKILFGLECYDDNCIEAVSSGWRGGVNFTNQARVEFSDRNNLISLGPIAAASLACFYAFNKTYHLTSDEIDINSGISLWNLNSGDEWHKDENDGPNKLNMPRNIWALGLGHLGQAYLWTLGLMTFDEPNKILFLLQDADTVEKENTGSQVLSSEQNIGYPKTRACMKFLENLGFRTQILEKQLVTGDSEQNWMENFPFLLNGVDNIKTRKSIRTNHLELFLDGATNGSSLLFDSFTMKNVLKIQKDINDLWPEFETTETILHKNLYDRYEKTHKCGFMTNIGVSTPFVGLFSSAIVVSELIRSLNCGKSYSIVSLQLRDLYDITAIENTSYDKGLLRFAI
jgi:molybdopterin/thiamine biosynthesis adenylyltransferase